MPVHWNLATRFYNAHMHGAFHPPYYNNTCTEKSVIGVLVYSTWESIYWNVL